MSDDTLERLARENPVPGPMQELPIEPLLARLEERSRLEDHGVKRRSRSILGATPAVLSVIVAVAVATVAITTLDHHRSTRATPSAAAHRSRAAQGGLAGRLFLDYLLPRTGADQTAGGHLQAFIRRATSKAESGCLAASGFPGRSFAAEPAPFQFGSVEFPNVPAMQRAHNIGVTTMRQPASPDANVPRSRRHEFSRTLASCEKGAAPVSAFFSERTAIRFLDEWSSSVFSAVSATPAMRAADARGAACSAATPFPADTVDQEMEAVEAKLTPLFIKGEDARADAVNARGVRVLVRCFGAAEALRNRMMAARRVHFVATHRAAIRRLEVEADRTAARDEARYGVRLDPPARS